MVALKLSCEAWLVIFGGLLAVLLRASTGLHPYSGEATPPMYGDYEAQRHWMEITTNLDVTEWYHNTSHNDLQYWGLDYPPLTAYHMYACGSIAKFLNENYTKLHDSRGYESEGHKLFMRYSVLISDVLIFLPAIIIYYWLTVPDDKGKKKKKEQGIVPLGPSTSIVLALLYPGIILIDHGHFQYNCVSLGLAVLAVTALLCEKDIIASFLFCLALNYKQMELYHAPPFFFYLLSTCVPKPGQGTLSGLQKLSKIAATVIFTFTVIWLPFLFSINDVLQVLHRLFPVARGIFEDKVANIWCALNIFYKYREVENTKMVRACLTATVSALVPSSVDLFLRPNKKKFVLALINSSLAFFLFGYQVHEKSILLAAVPVLLYMPFDPIACFWFLCLTTFSMSPLLLKDRLTLAAFALKIFFMVSFKVSADHVQPQFSWAGYYRNLLRTLLNVEYNKTNAFNVITVTYDHFKKNSEAVIALALHVIMSISLTGGTLLSIASLILKPSERYPDLYPLLTSIYCAVHFVGFFVYFNIKQLNIPQQDEDVKNVKFDSS
ncbi:unnamed protein product [Acanthoscelides obtectus]|uniref:Alpha-1,3-glucosyltransferase n=1 Tax=Acanthoscelides obtectus TaxID=200917 RepID=A0A9P0M1X1_ACAOB|nr:unnamed protein product [Acanthoscelides obtectus]CAK1663222.1 Probable dolichyl pyrophosphate Man9GlcNAc2 alpha-1,3-glucosyltransferase [Acanthoscelides obtectus]